MGLLQYLSAWPAGSVKPNVSTLNSFDGKIVANAAIVPAGVAGSISVFTTESTHVIIDINGYFMDAGATGPTGPTGTANFIPGPTGPTGATGATGSAGTGGLQAYGSFSNDSGSAYNVTIGGVTFP